MCPIETVALPLRKCPSPAQGAPWPLSLPPGPQPPPRERRQGLALAADPGSPDLQEPVEGRAALSPASFLGLIVCFVKPRQTGTLANWIYVPFDVETLWVGSRYPRAARLALAKRMELACQLDPFTPSGAPERWAQKEANSLRGATVMKLPQLGGSERHVFIVAQLWGFRSPESVSPGYVGVLAGVPPGRTGGSVSWPF